jgi:hypothetical protein
MFPANSDLAGTSHKASAYSGKPRPAGGVGPRLGGAALPNSNPHDAPADDARMGSRVSNGRQARRRNGYNSAEGSPPRFLPSLAAGASDRRRPTRGKTRARRGEGWRNYGADSHVENLSMPVPPP